MSDIAIRVENLGKKYKIGGTKQGSFRESFTHKLGHIFSKNGKDEALQNGQGADNEFWALKDINFEIKRGEAVGIIGRNGAGKSTLLKILSRITKPTSGRYEVFGRISSLLEVGTGFHPELTGRENVYLNGTILGMKRAEVKAKFDEIVAFSGVEKFIDTPVKHYSSGMQVRLAFAVAAHLEPEILIIDEVLAVGDSTFQKKCMDKMSEVAESGRTILFVSHNMQAVKNLCNEAIHIHHGKLIRSGDTHQIIQKYLDNDLIDTKQVYDFDAIKRNGKYKEGLLFDTLAFDKKSYYPGDNISFRLKLKSDNNKYQDLLFGINIKDGHGNNVMHLSNMFINVTEVHHDEVKIYNFSIPRINLKPGKYNISLFLRANEEIQDWISDVAIIEILDGNIYNFNNSSMINGLIQPEFSFKVEHDRTIEKYC